MCYLDSIRSSYEIIVTRFLVVLAVTTMQIKKFISHNNTSNGKRQTIFHINTNNSEISFTMIPIIKY